MNARRALRWAAAGFCFGTGILLARVVWGALSFLAGVLVPVLVVFLLAAVVLAIANPPVAHRYWVQGRAWFWPRTVSLFGRRPRFR